MSDNAGSLEARLCAVLNAYSQENGSNTPDFILARYLLTCLEAFNTASNRRESWYDVYLEPGRASRYRAIVQDNRRPMDDGRCVGCGVVQHNCLCSHIEDDE